ncbi:glutamate racemase [Atopobacter phocae]|uniref:glutamate racemase n=1 Tax=Atopobacter phocae TaxID=136492 RepID=UPI0004AFC7DF|nr:glutamate racemase [Atopobacter phocae]
MKSTIGIIDSGVGGLSVLKEAMRLLPGEDFIYLGDNARCPYGIRPTQEIYQFTKEMIDYLISQEVSTIVIACNTATAVALDQLKELYDIPLIGVIQPGAKKAVQTTNSKRVGVIGTKNTIQSKSYTEAIQLLDQSIHIFDLATQNFVDLVERNMTDESITLPIIERTLQPLMDESIDTLILGCTHFPLLSSVIQRAVGPNIRLIDSGYETAYVLKEKMSQSLDVFEQKNDRPPVNVRFLTTGDVTHFKTIAERWLQMEIEHVQQITLGEFK